MLLISQKKYSACGKARKIEPQMQTTNLKVCGSSAGTCAAGAAVTTDDQFEEQLRTLELLSLGIRKLEAELRAARLLTAQATVREREDDLALRRALALLHRADDTRDGIVGEGWRCKRGPSGHFMFTREGVVGEGPAAISSAELSRLEQALRVTQKDTEEARARDKVLEAKLDLLRRRVANAANICE